MTFKRIYYTLFRGIHKNRKWIYYGKAVLAMLLPNAFCRIRRRSLMRQFDAMGADDKADITERVLYYCKLPVGASVREINEQLPRTKMAPPYMPCTVGDYSLVNKRGNSVYFFDSYEHIRCFDTQLRFLMIPGDVFIELSAPAICKSRLVREGNSNNVLLNLDKVRHFLWIDDPFSWEEKQCRILFRGATEGKPRRERFLEMWSDNALCDLKSTGSMALYDHLCYRYIMCLEGNDVASNLKWVMSSNSVAVMPRPTCESWFMEGRLIPGYHYIEIADDYHDLIDKVEYYEAHPDEAKAIVEHAHEWVRQFQDTKREKIISLMVLERYFQQTGQ